MNLKQETMPILVLRIPNTYPLTSATPTAAAGAASHSWVINSKRAKKYKTVLAIDKNKIVVGVFELLDIFDDPNNPKRRLLKLGDASLALTEKFMDKDISDSFTSRERNPVRYFN